MQDQRTQASPEPTPTPEPEPTPSPSDEPKDTQYVVLGASGQEGPWVIVGVETVPSGGDARGRARKAAVEKRPELKEQITSGEREVWLVAVPKASFQPKQAGVKRTEVFDV